MKKKTILIIAIIVLLVILLFPIPMKLKDGGSIEFKALLYSVTKYHKLAPANAEKEYIDGIGIKVLGIEIYNSANKKIATNPHYYNAGDITTALTLEDEIDKNNNTIWCGTFQLVWNDLKNDLAKQDIVFTPQLKVIENLNKETFTTNDLSDKYYYKKVGTPSLELKAEIEKAIKDKFNETSDILDDFEWENRDPKDYFLYAMLKKNFEFEKVFAEFENGEFGSYENVKYFGVKKNSESDELRKQVEILYYNSKDDFAIKLKTKQEDEVILCKNPKGNTFNEIYKNIEQQKNTYKGNKNLQEGELLKVPNIKINQKTEFTEIQNRLFYFSNGDKYKIEKALQTIDFELDKTGGKIKSEAGMMVKNEAAILLDEIREFSVDDTFAIFLIEKGKKNPYFAGRISDISKVQNDVVKPNNIEEQNEVSKLSQMYIDMIEDIMSVDQGLQENIKFIAIDFSNFRRPLTEIEKSEKYNMPNFNTKEEKEEWEKQIKSKPIDDETKQEIVKYLKEKYPDVEIKQNTLEELQQQGLVTKDQGIKDGILIYVSSLPEIIEENKAQIELTKYRGPLGANFNEYEMKYKDSKWQLKTILSAIS